MITDQSHRRPAFKRLEIENWKLAIGNWGTAKICQPLKTLSADHFATSNFQSSIFNSIILFALLLALNFTAVGAANQKGKNKTRTESVNGLRKDAENFVKIKYSRQAEEAFRAVISQTEPTDEAERLVFWVQAGKWPDVRDFLTQFEPEGGRRLHTKICSELSSTQAKSTVLPQDVIALADASPVELDDKQVAFLGGLLKIALRDSESRTELLAQLHRGTERLGGADVHRQRMAARMLFVAGLQAEARTFGLPERDLRPGAVDQTEPETPAASTKRSWDELIKIFHDAKSDETTRTNALTELHETLLDAPPLTVEKLLQAVASDRQHPEVTRAIYGMIGQKTAAASLDVDFTSRTLHQELQDRALDALAQHTKLDAEPWQIFADLSANNWLVEANNTLKAFPISLKSRNNRDKNPHVSVEAMIEYAPTGLWLAALQSPLNSMVRIALVRMILLSDDIDRALPLIRDLVRSDGPVAVKLANAYLENWAQRHDPNLSADVLKQYRIDSQVIVLTRAQQEASLKQLGELLASLDEPTRKLLDETQLVRAFDFCHSRAEIYTQAHLVEVFGPVEQVSPSLMLSLTERTRIKLASHWRDIAVQRDAATKRTASDVFQLVSHGYDEAARTAEQWLASHADDWRMNCTVGSLLSDWAEFAYFQSIAMDESGDRFASYLKHTQQALSRFQSGAAAYGALVPKLKRSEFDLLPYRAWFYGLLGLTHDGDVNLRKGVTREEINKIRQALLDLPGGASATHIQLFSTMVADNITANRIAPEMKYRYLSSAVQITGRQPTIYPAEEKIKYYDALLKEIRLQTRLDGSDRIHTPGMFGVFVSLVHTRDVARESGGFGKYLVNEVQRTMSGKSIVEKPLYRDRFEEALRVSIADFFEVRSITFADPASGARDLREGEALADPRTTETHGSAGASPSRPTAGWQETPLAYLLLQTKDKTVDRFPALEIELDFFDREGKVIIPVPSNPILIEMNADAPSQRPVANMALTQIVDSRELSDSRLKVDVTATAHGLVPDLDQLLQLSDYQLTVQEVFSKEGLLVRELHNGPEGMYPISERSWTVELDPTPLLRGASSRVEFDFPVPKSVDTQVTYRRFEDLDSVEAAAKVTLVEGAEVAKVAQTDYRLWIGGVVALLVVGLFAILALRRKPSESFAASPLFATPSELTPFSVIALLHRIQSSHTVPLNDEQRLTLKTDIQTLEQHAFARNSTAAPTHDLSALACRWLNAVQDHQ